MRKRVASRLYPNCFYTIDVSQSVVKDVSEITEYYTNEKRIAPHRGIIIGLPVSYESHRVYPAYKNNYTGINVGEELKVTPGVQVGFFEVTDLGDETSEWFDECEHLTLFDPDAPDTEDFEGMRELVGGSKDVHSEVVEESRDKQSGQKEESQEKEESRDKQSGQKEDVQSGDTQSGDMQSGDTQSGNMQSGQKEDKEDKQSGHMQGGQNEESRDKQSGQNEESRDKQSGQNEESRENEENRDKQSGQNEESRDKEDKQSGQKEDTESGHMQGGQKEDTESGENEENRENEEKESGKVSLKNKARVKKSHKKVEILSHYRRSSQWFMKYLEEYLNIQDDGFNIDFRGKTMGADSLFAALAHCLDDISTTDVRHTFTSDTLSPFKEKYNEANEALREVNKIMREVNEKARELHATKETTKKDDVGYYEYVKKGREIKDQYELLKMYRDVYRSRVSKYSFMKGVKNVGQLRRKILDGETHGVEEMFSVMEKNVNVRVIILDRDAYEKKDYTNVVRLVHRPTKRDVNEGALMYVMIERSRDGTLFDAVSYESMLQFDDDELPDYILNEIRLYGARMGEEEVPCVRDELEMQRIMVTTEGNQYGNGLSTFVVGINAPVDMLPGTWFRESIDMGNMNFQLWKMDRGWRRLLSNDYERSFVVKDVMPSKVTSVLRNEVGGEKVRNYEDKNVKEVGRFMSVTHYLLSRIYPDLRRNGVSIFALESGTFSAYTVKAALSAISGPAMPLRYEDEYTGIKFKFMNGKLRDILLATEDAMLLEYFPNRPPRLFHVLMRVRSELRTQHFIYKK